MHRHLDPRRVGQFHLVDLGLQTESESVKPQLQEFFQLADALRPVAPQPQIKILGGAGHAGKAQFHRHATFEVVRGDDALLHRLLQHTAEREKRDPPPEAFLIKPLFARDTRESFLQTLCRLCAHAVACAF